MSLVKQELNYLETLEHILSDVIQGCAAEVDKSGAFPRQAMNTLGRSGLLGLISAHDVGGIGKGLREAVHVIERVARECGSTAMVLSMHYAGTAVIEAYGPREVREEIAAGNHLTIRDVVEHTLYWERHSINDLAASKLKQRLPDNRPLARITVTDPLDGRLISSNHGDLS